MEKQLESRYQRRVLVLVYALLGLLALLPLFCMGDYLSEAPKVGYSDLLQGYDPVARWGSICRDIDFPPAQLGDEHDICELPRLLECEPCADIPVRVASNSNDIGYQNPPVSAPLGLPVVDHWETGMPAGPGMLVAAGPGGGGGGWAAHSVASGGGGGLLFFDLDDDSDDSNGSGSPRGGSGNPDSDGPSDPGPNGDPSVPEPTAGLLFAVGFLAIYRRRNAGR